ncbi:MAG TPA: antitoxin Xre/MbcA/ParS toxin-binding domain-containing protein [Gemmatimonadales bacterium]|nr:antitoxin Xre/MbcA/ParS toxin-binding domain-containing protein [Gemmatimonadales bacterium]
MAKVAERATAPTTPDVDEYAQKVRRGRADKYSYATFVGLKTVRLPEILKHIEGGLAFSAWERLRRNTALSTTDLAALVQIPLRTLHRRKEEGRFQPDESDRLLRASRLFARALDLFEGDAESAREWLSASQPALGGAKPIAVARTEVGAKEVESLIGRLEHGIPS